MEFETGRPDKKRKIVLAGATGFIGGALQERYARKGYDVKMISRRPEHIAWNDFAKIAEALNGADLLVNLAGRSVNCRYNERNRREIMESRTETTRILGEAAAALPHPPALWINSGTATIYRDARDRPMTEESGEIGSGFSVDVAKAWEEAFFSADTPRTRKAVLRIAIVLGKGGGVMTPYVNLVRFGLGGHQGPGDQRFSWIHLEDLCRMVEFLEERQDLSGVFNASAPEQVTNAEQMRIMREAYGRRFGLPAPAWMLEMGAVAIRTETELILKSRWVAPERMLRAGFEFRYPTLREAMAEIAR
ncbi:TIGR01777 family oxidoreductase [Saccharibacillus alkalitolerans]|uniref:TIGR01777 family protein n=1 Tax=Saccharibacillus alkalitolerans TaxID=2705290 RepID=A0ABX0F8Z2_9BACL|nr:TIGR01777 family oxidoreductase [Saccharibacillus alkalitolerans]NGZ76380.1 TIGR01777 family protein [Saccharibacillus alkalitolerans]